MKRWRLKNGTSVPFSLRPKKTYPFPTPIRPGTFLLCKGSPNKGWRKNVGRQFRVGYYSRLDGLDCIWLVNNEGKYEQTIDHQFLAKYFEITALSKERSLYGKNRPRLGPVT
jgi:hypothetical protein